MVKKIATISTGIYLMMLYSSCSKNVINAIQNYQSQQFYDSSLNKHMFVKNFHRINRRIIQNNSSDSFWIISYFSNYKYSFSYSGLYVSEKDTLFYEKKGNRIIQYKSRDGIEGSQEILDSIFMKKPFTGEWHDRTIMTMVQKVILIKDSVIISGFNLNNINEKVYKFN